MVCALKKLIIYLEKKSMEPSVRGQMQWESRTEAASHLAVSEKASKSKLVLAEGQGWGGINQECDLREQPPTTTKAVSLPPVRPPRRWVQTQWAGAPQATTPKWRVRNKCCWGNYGSRGHIHYLDCDYALIYICQSLSTYTGFPGASDGKESACSTGDWSSIPRSKRSLGEGKGYPLQYPCLENPMDRGAWWATAHGVTNTQTQLSD